MYNHYWWKLILLYWKLRLNKKAFLKANSTFLGNIKCSHCFKGIEPSSEIFYYNDQTYCTYWCRTKKMTQDQVPKTLNMK